MQAAIRAAALLLVLGIAACTFVVFRNFAAASAADHAHEPLDSGDASGSVETKDSGHALSSGRGDGVGRRGQQGHVPDPPERPEGDDLEALSSEGGATEDPVLDLAPTLPLNLAHADDTTGTVEGGPQRDIRKGEVTAGLNPQSSSRGGVGRITSASSISSMPGSRLKDDADVARFRWAMSCVGEGGSWAYEAEPRPVAWEPQGLSHCDLMWLRASPNAIAGHVANLARTQQEWRVRESLKYVWVVPEECRSAWQPFDASAFCRAAQRAKGAIMLVGDSTTRHMFLTLYNHMLLGKFPGANLDAQRHGKDEGAPGPLPEQEAAGIGASVEVPDVCKKWEKEGTIREEMHLCKVMLGCKAAGKATGDRGGMPMVYHVRNDRLTVETERREPWEKGNEFFLPWLRLIGQWDVGVVVLNRGVHRVATKQLKFELERTLATLRKRYPDILLLYRASVPGHVACENHTRPLMEIQDPSTLPYGWGALHEQNGIARRIVEKYGGVFLDVDLMTSLRADGHFGYHGDTYDCLHYCAPGPMDSWVRMLYNALEGLV